MANRIQIRRGSSATWALIDPILSDGEIGWERDTNIFKVGDGVSIWSVLPPITIANLGIGEITGLQAALDLKADSSDVVNFETTTQLNARDVSNRARANHTGVQAISTVTGLQTALDLKLESLDIVEFETTAQLNTRDTNNRNRANHTGSQAISTVTGLQADLDAKEITSRKVNNLSVPSATDYPSVNAVLGALDEVSAGELYQGDWNAATNTPTLVSSVGTEGHYYRVTTAGTTTLDGISVWEIGDEVLFRNGVWIRRVNINVTSVNGEVGVVVLDADDIDDTSTAHKFVTAADITKLSNLSGTNTGDQDISNFETTTQLNARDTVNRARANHTGTQAIATVDGLQSALDLKLVAADIADFETTAQLNGRDTANRSRTNHTGAQAISTVTGLQTALDGKAPTVHTHTASDITDFSTEVNILIATNGPGFVSVAVPLTPTSAGSLGYIAVDAEFLYVCTATDTWIRLPRDTSAWSNA